MVQAVLHNLARMTVASTGTGTLTLNAAVPGFLTFDLAGASTVSSGETIFYAINDTNQSEIGTGTYISSALTLSRTPLDSTNAGAAIDMTTAAQVFITPPSDAFNGRLIQITDFTAGGTYTPPSWLRFAVVHCIGGGGGGGAAYSTAATGCNGGSGGGGGVGAMSVVLSSLIASSGVAVVIGGGGTGGSTAGVAPSSGGTTTFGGTIVVAGGGLGGANSADAGTGTATAQQGALTNSSGTGDFIWPGGSGQAGLGMTSINLAMAGAGGGVGGPFGVGQSFARARFTTAGSAGPPGVNYGGGGGGAAIIGSSVGGAGGDGAGGRCVVEEYA